MIYYMKTILNRWGVYETYVNIRILLTYVSYTPHMLRRKIRGNISFMFQVTYCSSSYAICWVVQVLVNTNYPQLTVALEQLYLYGYYVIWKYIFLLVLNLYEASHGAAAQSVTVKPTGCWFDPHSRRWNIYLNLYFHFFALVSRTSAACHSTRNASRIRQKVGNGVS